MRSIDRFGNYRILNWLRKLYATARCAPPTREGALEVVAPQEAASRRFVLGLAGGLSAGAASLHATLAQAHKVDGNTERTAALEQVLEVVKTVAEFAEPDSPEGVGVSLCLGYRTPGDGGGGLFVWSPASTATADRGMVFEGRRGADLNGRWLRQAPHAEVDVRWFGARGDGRSDDTDAFARALAYLMSFGIDSAAPWAPARPALYVPGGKYLVRPLPPLANTQNIKIRGDGASATKILLVADRDAPGRGLFDLGIFSANPKDDWQGSAQGFELSDIYLGVNLTRGAKPDENRFGFGIRDNGSGALHIERVRFHGFQYAIVAPSGSDFSRFIDCHIRNCNVALYLGPGSQQVHMARLDIAVNKVGIVLDAVPQGDIQSCYFMDQDEADIVFEYTGRGRTRFGLAASQKLYRGMFSIKDCWFETGTREGSPGRLAQHLHTTAAPGAPSWSGPSGVIVQRVFLVSGKRNMTKLGTVYFWRCESGIENRIEDIRIWGDYIDDIVDRSAAGEVSVIGEMRRL